MTPEGIHVATATVRGLVRDDGPIRPDAIAELYAALAAETAGPQETWRTVVDVT